MFHYMSGFISDINLDDDAEVFVFLLLPQKFSHKLNRDLFPYNKNARPDYDNITSSVFIDHIGNPYDHYIPFCLPFKASYSRDCGIHVNREEEPVVRWFEDYFKVDLVTYLYELSEQTHIEASEFNEINHDNILEHLSVAIEHQDFVVNISDYVYKDEHFNYNFKYCQDFFHMYKDNHLSQKLINNSYTKSLEKRMSPYDLIINSDQLEEEGRELEVELFKEFIILSTLTYFIQSVNKTFKPCSFGHQDNEMTLSYIELMNNSKMITSKKYLNNEGDS